MGIEVKPPVPGDTLAVAFTMSVDFGGGRSMVVQTYMPQDATKKDMNALVDKLAAVVDRQGAKYSLVELNANLKVHEDTLKQMETDYTEMPARAQMAWAKSGKRGEYREGPQEAAAKGTVETNIRRYRQEVTKIKAQIAEQERIAAEG